MEQSEQTDGYKEADQPTTPWATDDPGSPGSRENPLPYTKALVCPKCRTGPEERIYKGVDSPQIHDDDSGLLRVICSVCRHTWRMMPRRPEER